MWELALAGGGRIALSFGISFGAVKSFAAVALGTITPVGLVATGVVVVAVVVTFAIDLAETPQNTDSKSRVDSPVGRRNNYNSRKKAEQAAKKAGGGKDPIKHPKGFHGNKRPHFHPNVKNKFRLTPHGASAHDHYFYPR